MGSRQRGLFFSVGGNVLAPLEIHEITRTNTNLDILGVGSCRFVDRTWTPSSKSASSKCLLNQTLPGSLIAEFGQGADRILAGHLLAPLIDKIGVVERTRLDVCSFGGSLDLIVAKGFSDQYLRCVLDLHR
jgi:hypothetical protein